MFERRSLGIAFEADGTVKAAELVSSVRTVTLTNVWSVQPEGSDNFDSWKRAVEILRESGVDVDNAVIGIPESFIYRKHLSFPFSNRKRIMQILNSELDGEIPLPINTVVADFIAGQSDGSSGIHGIAMACDKQILSRFLDMFASGARLRGVQSMSIGLAVSSTRAGMTDGVAVHGRSGEAVLIELRSSKIKIIKRLALTGSEEKDVRLLLEGIRQHTVVEDEVYLGCGDLNEKVSTELAHEASLNVRHFLDLDIVQSAAGVNADKQQMALVVGLALGGFGVGEALPFDLRQGSFKQVTPLAELRVPIMTTAAIFLLVSLLAMASLVTSLNQIHRESKGLKGQLEEGFKELFPDARHQVGQEAGHVKGELDKLKKRMTDLAGLEGRGALSVLAGLSAAIPEDVILKLDELSYDSNKLRFEGSVTSFDAVDRIKAALDSDPLFADVKVQNARVGADINKVTFRLQMEIR